MYLKSDVPTIYVNKNTNAFYGKVVWSPVKSIWVTSMYF